MAYRIFFVLVSLVACGLPAPRVALAQAWVPAKGEGTVSVLYQDTAVKDHFFSRGQRVDRGEIQSSALLADFTYGLTERLAVTVGVPFIRSRYQGRQPHPSAQDDGSAHYGLQDLRASVRYTVVDGPVVVTPFVGTNMPTHKYEYFAHSAFGIRVREVEVGTYVGYVPRGLLSNAFVQARYAYGFPETVAGVKRNKSYVDVEVGYFVMPRLRVFTMGVGQTTHGGIHVPDAGYAGLPPELQQHHDRIGRIELLDISTGAQFTVNESFDVFGSYTRSLAGRYTHAINRAITLGVSWNFGGRLGSLLGAVSSAPQSVDASRRARCLCMKKTAAP